MGWCSFGTKHPGQQEVDKKGDLSLQRLEPKEDQISNSCLLGTTPEFVILSPANIPLGCQDPGHFPGLLAAVPLHGVPRVTAEWRPPAVWPVLCISTPSCFPRPPPERQCKLYRRPLGKTICKKEKQKSLLGTEPLGARHTCKMPTAFTLHLTLATN